MKISINAGHGPRANGHDSGAIGPTGVQEARQVLRIAEVVEQKLKANGHEVLLIHTGDLSRIASMSNAWKAEYFISIHRNAHTTRTANGIETFALSPGGMGEKIARAIQTELILSFKLTDRGVKFANFQVLRQTQCPAALTEIGFISNPAEERLFEDSANVEKAAEAICIGFFKALGIPYTSSRAIVKSMIICSGEVDKRAGDYLGDWLKCEVKLINQVTDAQVNQVETVYVIGSPKKYNTKTINVQGRNRYDTARLVLDLCK